MPRQNPLCRVVHTELVAISTHQTTTTRRIIPGSWFSSTVLLLSCAFRHHFVNSRPSPVQKSASYTHQRQQTIKVHDEDWVLTVRITLKSKHVLWTYYNGAVSRRGNFWDTAMIPHLRNTTVSTSKYGKSVNKPHGWSPRGGTLVESGRPQATHSKAIWKTKTHSHTHTHTEKLKNTRCRHSAAEFVATVCTMCTL